MISSPCRNSLDGTSDVLNATSDWSVLPVPQTLTQEPARLVPTSASPTLIASAIVPTAPVRTMRNLSPALGWLPRSRTQETIVLPPQCVAVLTQRMKFPAAGVVSGGLHSEQNRAEWTFVLNQRCACSRRSRCCQAEACLDRDARRKPVHGCQHTFPGKTEKGRC